MNFSITLDGDMAQQANKDASALQRLYDATEQESKALARLEKQMKQASRSGSTNVETGRALSSAITAQKAKVSALTDELVRLGGAGFEPAKKKTSSLADEIRGMSLNSGKLTAGLRGLGVAGLAVAAVLGVISVAGAAAIAVITKLVQLSIQFTEARGDFERSLEVLYGSEQSAKHTYDVISTITDRVAVSQEKALEIFGKLERAGLRNGDQAVRATESIAKAEAARQGAGEALQGVIERASRSKFFSISRDEMRAAGLTFKELATTISKQTGVGMRDAELALRTGRVALGAGLKALAETVDSKLGPIANKKFMTVGVQANRLKDNIGRLFSEVDTSKMAFALQRMADLFNENTVTGAALQQIVTGIFSGVARAVEIAGPYVETFFKTLVLIGLKAYNAFRPVAKSIADLFSSGQEEQASFEQRMINLANNIGAAFKVIADTLKWIVDNAGTITTVVGGIASQIPGIGPAISAGLNGAKSALTVATADLGNGAKPKQAGENIADGVAAGIKDGTPKVQQAMDQMASLSLMSFQNRMQIRSPSRVMMVQGRYLDEGLAQGIAANDDKPRAAMAEAIPVPQQRVSPNVTTDNSTRTGNVVNFGERSIVVEVTGGDTEAMRETLTSTMIDVFDQLGLAMGAEEVA